MKATDILPASRIPRATSKETAQAVATVPFSQSRRRRRTSHRLPGYHPSRGAMFSVLLAALFVFGAVAAFVAVALGT